MAKAGTKSGGLAWAFAFGSVTVALLINFLGGKINLPTSIQYGLYVGIIGLAGVLAVYLTKAGAGGGILAFFVASIAMAAGTYFLMSMAVSEAAAAVTTIGATDSASVQLGQGAASTLGAIAGVFAAVVSMIVTFGAGLTGCMIGNSMKKKALAGEAPVAQARLAA